MGISDRKGIFDQTSYYGLYRVVIWIRTKRLPFLKIISGQV